MTEIYTLYTQCTSINAPSSPMETTKGASMPLSERAALLHPSLPGVRITPLGSQRLQRGIPQSVLVRVDPGAEIPLHAHKVDAHMDIVTGTATILSNDDDSGKQVEDGHHWLFEAGGMHGFRAGPGGLVFVSTNGGIVDEDGEWDIEFAC